MKPALVDVSVLILFFNRPKLLAQVFEQVKKARPARLFLYQDGPRGERDMPGIEACRKVVADMRSTPQLPREELRLRPIGIHGTEVGILLVGQMYRA